MTNLKNTLLSDKCFLLFFSIILLPTAALSEESNHAVLSKHGIVAYTWNSNPTIENANLSTSQYTFNNGRAVSRTRLSTGTYQVKFDGLSCQRGQFIVNAYGGSDYKSCRIGSWSGKKDCEVSVYCFDAQGQHFDSQFNLLFID